MGLFDSIFGKKSNVERGREKEDQFRSEREMMGEEVRRTGIGSDFETVHCDPFTGRISERHKHEIKRNNSPLSKRQKKTRGLIVHRYIDGKDAFGIGSQHRVEDKHGNELERDMFTGKYRRKDRDTFGDMFGAGPSSRSLSSKSRRRSSSSDFDSLMGLGGSSNKRNRRKKNDLLGF